VPRVGRARRAHAARPPLRSLSLLSAADKCLLDNPEGYGFDTLFDFTSVARQQANTSTNSYNYKATIPADRGGEYSLFFANCQSDSVVVSFQVTVTMYNVDAKGQRDYLSAGQALLPVVFTVMAVLFFLAAATWAGVLWTHKATTHKIHYLMLALACFKALATMCEAGMYHMQRTTGNADGWNIAYYIFSILRGTLLFTVIVLLGTGWSFLKPFLSERERNIILVVFPLQVLTNVADIVLQESGPSTKGWFTWRDIFHLLDIICCCAILFPIVWSIKHLREAAHSDGKAARNLHKLTLFRQFYVMVVSFIYFTRIVVYLLQSTMPFQYVWISDLAGELATFAFYVFTGFKFRPVGDNPYFHLEMDEVRHSPERVAGSLQYSLAPAFLQLDEAEQELVRREVADGAQQARSKD